MRWSVGKFSIKARVRAIMLLTSALVLFASFAAFVIYEVISFRAQQAQHLSTLAAVIADNSAAPLAFHDKKNAQEILSALKAEPDITAAVLYDGEGAPFATFPTNLAPTSIPVLPEQAGMRFQNNSERSFKPILQERKQLGTLYLSASLSALYRRLGRYAIIATVIFLASVAAAAVLSAILQRRITRPVVALTDTAQKVARWEDYSLRAPRLSSDEIGLLADAFNRMLAQTQQHQNRLAEQARLLDLSFDAIFVLDQDGKITYWNHGAEEMYGFSAQEATGRISDDLLHTRFPEPKEAILQRLHRDNRWIGELEQTRKDGTKLTVISRWALDRDENGAPSGTLETNNDITDRKRAQHTLELTVAERTAQLRETIGELEAFSYSISHDMRAPLRAIAAYANALREDNGPQLPNEAVGYLNNIVSSATRMDQLITDVLDYSRIARAQRLPEKIDVDRLLEEVISHFPELQPGKAEIRIQKPISPVLGDRASLGQCVSNLLTNAVKFVAPGVKPQVTIRAEAVPGPPPPPANGRPTGPTTRSDRSFIRLWFEDNGIGIDKADLGRIFGIFERVHPREKFEGTGIGLAIVKKAVERMGGRVGVESEPGKGSRFWLELGSAESKVNV